MPHEPKAVIFWVVVTVITTACYAALLSWLWLWLP